MNDFDSSIFFFVLLETKAIKLFIFYECPRHVHDLKQCDLRLQLVSSDTHAILLFPLRKYRHETF